MRKTKLAAKTGIAAWAFLALCVFEFAPLAQANPRFRGVAPLADQPPVVLVSRDVKPAPILIRADAPPQEEQAASELARYLAQISGAEFHVSPAADKLPDRAILVGNVGGQPLPDVSREGFLVRTDGQTLRICGGTPHATLFGVFALLEEQLGCRWWSWNEEHVPQREVIEVAAQNTHIEPAFQRHNVYNQEAQNQRNLFAWKLRTISLTNFTGGHNLCAMLKPFAEERLDFLPMDETGQRKFNNLHMNYTAEGMDEVLAEVLRAQVLKRKAELDGVIYFAGMGDWYGGMDLSPESKRIYNEELWVDPDGRQKPGYSATLLRMINRTAERLDKELPGIQVGTFAYMSLEAPPGKTRPRRNVAIRLPRLRHDTVRSILESEKNQSFRRNLDRWLELAPDRVYIWEYGANFRNFLWPFPCLRSMAENIKYYHQGGVAGVSIQGNYVSTGGDLAALKNYVWAKLLWDPTRDAETLVREFCAGYYGPAAKEMLAYVSLMEDSVRGDTPISADEFDERCAYLTPELVAKAKSVLHNALAKTEGVDSDPYYRRVKEAEVSLEASLLWKPGPLIEDGQRLIRSDLGEDTFGRANELVKYCRDASPREWGNGVKYRMSFLTLHGGPMPILKRGPIAVKVAPAQNGQIRSVLYGEKAAIDGSHMGLALNSAYYELTARAKAQVQMQADLGVTMWSRAHQKQTAYQTVELDEQGVVRCTGEFERRGASFKTNQAVIESRYQVDGQPEQVVIEYQDGQGAWRTARIDAYHPKADIPLARRLRLTRRDRGLIIHEEYAATEQPPIGSVEFDPKAGVITVSVDTGETQVAAEGRTVFAKRTIRVEPLTH